MAMPELFTIGYEKAKPDAVLAELKRAKVKLLIDTRAVAASRRPGFSKRQLAALLDQAGIAYLHLQKLGTPAEGREAARSGDLKTLWKIYAQAPQDQRGHCRDRRAGRAGRRRQAHLPAVLRARRRALPSRQDRRDRDGAHRRAGHRSGAAAVLAYSAGCATLASRSTPLTSKATKAVPITKPSATTAITPSTRSKPPRPCRNAIIEAAAPEIR